MTQNRQLLLHEPLDTTMVVIALLSTRPIDVYTARFEQSFSNLSILAGDA